MFVNVENGNDKKIEESQNPEELIINNDEQDEKLEEEEVDRRLLRLFQVLIKINDRLNIVKEEE